MRSLFRSTALWVAMAAGVASAAEPKISPLITGLDNPCGVAIQPMTGDLFVADSAAGRVIRYNPNSGGRATPVITDFGQDIYGKGPMYNIGPLGLLFLNRDTLVVGGGGKVDGSELLYIYTVPASGKMIKADAAKHELGPIAPGEQSQMGEGNFYALAADRNGIYITSNGDDTKGWILKASLNNGQPGELKPFIATKVALEDTDAPVGICMSKEGDLVVGQMGEVNKPNDSLLTTYDPKSGKLLSRAATDLHDIAALAYSPSGKLYALDFAWIDAKEGGLFRLDVSKDGGTTTVKSVKIAPLDKPTAMVFDQQGACYVTTFETAPEGSNKPAGRLLKITGDL
jgi:sugar lactone lactonase YvrE